MSARMRSRVRLVREPLQHRLDAAGLHPLRQEVLERVAAGGIGIGIAVDVEPARLGRGDHVERARGLAPIVHARAFEVHDLDMDAALLRDLDRLRDRLQHLVRLVANVGEVAGIVALDHAAERDHLVRLGIGAGGGEQAGRKPERARPRARPPASAIMAASSAGVGDRLAMPMTMRRRVLWPDQHAGVHGGGGKAVEIVRERRRLERQPGRARAQVVAQQLDLARQRRRDREAAMADDLGGDALAHLALGLGIDRQGKVGMGLDVDEAGRDREAGGVDDLGCRVPEVRSDGGDAAVADGEIAVPAGGAAAVEDQAAADQDIAGHGNSAVANAVGRNNQASTSSAHRLRSGETNERRPRHRASRPAVRWLRSGVVHAHRARGRFRLAWARAGSEFPGQAPTRPFARAPARCSRRAPPRGALRFSAVRVTAAARARSELIAVQGAVSCT